MFIVESDSLVARLAQTPEELLEAQRVRYQVFYEEWDAIDLNDATRHLKIDQDLFDSVCDHLIVIDQKTQCVVGTYRLTTREAAEKVGGFYSRGEFDLTPLLLQKDTLLELGRACVLSGYRGKSVIKLLWAGIARYASEMNARYLFGCGSFYGIDPEPFKEALAYLHHFHRAPAELCPKALEAGYLDMNFMPAECVNVEVAARQLPALIRSYLHIGGWVGEGAFIDPIFQTLDVCVVVDMKRADLSDFLLLRWIK